MKDRVLHAWPVSSHLQLRGGARVGWIECRLADGASVGDAGAAGDWLSWSGTYGFAPDQVVAIERHAVIPVLGWGVRIVHCRTDCPAIFVFWCLGNPEGILQGNPRAGFLPTAPVGTSRSGAAFRCVGPAMIGVVVIWNARFLLDFMRRRRFEGLPWLVGLSRTPFCFCASVECSNPRRFSASC